MEGTPLWKDVRGYYPLELVFPSFDSDVPIGMLLYNPDCKHILNILVPELSPTDMCLVEPANEMVYLSLGLSNPPIL